MPDSFAQSAEGIVLVANGIDPARRWDGFLSLAAPAGVRPPDPAVVPTIAGSGTGSLAGTYAVFLRYVDANGNPSNLGTASAQLKVGGVSGVTIGNLPPTPGGIARRQVLRNTDGQLTTFYVDLDTTDLSSPTLTGTSTDGQLAAAEAVPLLDSDGFAFANRYTPPPDTHPFLAYHLNHMWLAGSTTYSEGSCVVSRGAATVRGVGTAWPVNFAGRFLYVQGAGRAYEIRAVDAINQVLTLTESYADADQPFAGYAIKPSPGDESVLAFSEAGLPEAWPATNGLALPQDGDQVTGLVTFDSFLWVLKRRKMYRMSAQTDPRTDAFIFFSMGRGCVNQRCALVVENLLYLLDEGGIFRTDGGGEADQLSQPIQNLFRRDEPAGINWAASRFFHAVFDPGGETVRWFVALRSDYLPRHALALHYKTGKWWVEEYPVPIAGSALGRVGRTAGSWADDGAQVFLGGPAGEVYALGGAVDGVQLAGPTTRGTATAAGLDTLTDAGAAFDPTWKNVPVVVATGRGKDQVRVVVAATATVLTLNQPWAVAPEPGDVYQVGGIRFRYTSQRLRYTPSEDDDGCSIELQYVPTAARQTFNLRTFQDFSARARTFGREVRGGQRTGAAVVGKKATDLQVDMSEPWGAIWSRFDHHRERSTNSPRLIRFQLEGVSGPEVVQFGECVLNGMVD